MMINTITDFLSSPWSHALGWTLVHSLWQALVLWLLVHVALRIVPIGQARSRYAVACAGLGAFVIATAMTFTLSFEGSVERAPVTAVSDVHFSSFTVADTQRQVSPVNASLSAAASVIESYMPLWLAGWVLGVLIFSVRLSSGVWYTFRLRSMAVDLDGPWSDYVHATATRLGIRRLVRLATSVRVTTPMVIGFLRPVIILPVSMLSGLTSEQIETVLIHELAHIRRHDFLVNLIQSILETVFFFNPFVWMISGIIRREREYCCDDLVVSQHGGAAAYAHALAQLASARLSGHGFALTLGEGKYQLLDRIKRIMEKSASNYSRKGRMIMPALLVVTALMCISWLGTHSGKETGEQSSGDQDTVIRKKDNSARYSRRSIITLDENGQPHEEVVEEFEGDESLRPLLDQDIAGAVDSFMFPSIPGIHGLQDLHGLALTDSLPLRGRFFDDKEWEAFYRRMEEVMRKNLEEFESFRDNDLSALMRDLDETFRSKDWPDKFDFDMHEDMLNGFRHFDDSASFEGLRHQLEKLHDLEFDLKELNDGLRLRENNLREFEDAIRDELITDGYLSQDETIDVLQWSDDSFKVNGTEVEKEHLEKYRRLREKHLRDPEIEKVE